MQELVHFSVHIFEEWLCTYQHGAQYSICVCTALHFKKKKITIIC